MSRLVPAPDLDGACRLYRQATEYIEDASLKHEIDWQRSIEWGGFGETDLLREAAWVIACSGFRESTVRRAFGYLSLCYCDWESAESILTRAASCTAAARSAFANERKLEAIVAVARRVAQFGFHSIKAEILKDPLQELRKFDYIGPVTCWHLAKNLGFDAAKPDRHLVRLASRFGYTDVFSFCGSLAREVGEQAKVVDLVLWRYLADNPGVRTA